MTWRLQVNHRTRFQYESPVRASYNEVRMTPLTDTRQTTINAELRTEPYATIHRYWDYWGTQVSSFDVHHPHEELVITSSATVESEPARSPELEASWDELAADRVADDFAELLAPTGYVPVWPELQEVARRLTVDTTPQESVCVLSQWVHDNVEYQSGVTGVHTSAPEAWKAGRGVCQDYSHLGLLLLRSVGIPCRYVSGYLHPSAEAEVGATVPGASHAWLEAWTGEWWAYDVTSCQPVGEQHVTLARGRDYADVSPLRGIYSGGGASDMTVEVHVTRLR